MIRKTIAAFVCLFMSVSLFSDSSDFGFMPLRRKLRYVEEFYQLYTQNHMAATDSIERNLVYLQYALNSPYIHPLQALCVINTREEHARYQLVLRGRIAFLLAKGFVQLGYRYDKEDIYFYNLEFYKDLLKSFDIALYHYKEAIAYWDETVRVVNQVMDPQFRHIKLRGSLMDDMLNEAARIYHGDINYRRIIDFRIRDLERKKARMEELARIP